MSELVRPWQALGRRKRLITVLASFLVAAALLASCGSSPASNQRLSVAVDVGSIPGNLNGTLAVGSRAVTDQIDALILPRAFYMDATGNYVLDTRYVTSAEVVSVNPQVVEYKINTKATWSDGHALSAGDFVYTYEAQRRGAEGALPSYWGLLDHQGTYNSVSAVQANQAGNQVTVRFSKPDANWRMLFNPILPSRYMQANGFVASMSLGQTGFPTIDPYRIDSYTSGAVVLSAKSASGAPFSSLAFRTATVPSAAKVTVSATSSVADLSGASLFVPGTRLYRVSFNLQTTSVWFRRAVAASIDRNALYQHLYARSKARFLSYNPPGSNLFLGSQSGYSDSQGSDGVPSYARSTDLFILGGFTYSPAGFLDPISGPLTATLLYDGSSSTSGRIAELVSRMVGYMGVHVSLVREPDAASLKAALAHGAFTMAITSADMTLGPTALADSYLTRSSPATDIAPLIPVDASAIVAQAGTDIYPVASAKVFASVDSLIWQQMATFPLLAPPVGVTLSGQAPTSTQLAALLQLATSGGFETSQPRAYPR